MEEKKYWIFTFGSGQLYEGYFVKIFGTFYEARSKMFELFGREWSFQYSEEEWDEWLKSKPEWIPAEKEFHIPEYTFAKEGE